MHWSHISLRWFGSLALTITGAAGCNQSGTGNPVLSTAPGSDGAPLSVSSSNGAAQLGPGASYDATGSWHFITSDQRTGEPLQTFDAPVSEDGEGNLSFFAPPVNVPVLLTRLGSGRTISYKITVFDALTQPCGVDLSGTAQLDTTTNSGKGHLTGINGDCTKLVGLVTFTKN